MTSVQRELKESWESILKKYQSKEPVDPRALKEPPIYRRETPYVPSLKVDVLDNCLKKEPLKYTGNKILGIGTLHKSNAVPIFSEEEAIAISRMRR
jgi:hypothetical protein